MKNNLEQQNSSPTDQLKKRQEAEARNRFNQAWKALTGELKQTFGRRPNIQSLLFLIGVQELGQLDRPFEKEEKQDLMHIAVCKLLSQDGYFEFKGRDEDGWPHYRPIKALPEDTVGLKTQETLLKKMILRYFEKEW